MENKYEKVTGQQIRKLQKNVKELAEKNDILEKEKESLEGEESKFLKMCANLESKLSKFERKNKVLKE